MKCEQEFCLLVATQRSVTETKLRAILASLIGSVLPTQCMLTTSALDPSISAVATLAREKNLPTRRVTVPLAVANSRIARLRINERLAASTQGCVAIWDGKDSLIKHLLGAAQFHKLRVWTFPLE